MSEKLRFYLWDMSPDGDRARKQKFEFARIMPNGQLSLAPARLAWDLSQDDTTFTREEMRAFRDFLDMAFDFKDEPRGRRTRT